MEESGSDDDGPAVEDAYAPDLRDVSGDEDDEDDDSSELSGEGLMDDDGFDDDDE